MALPLRCARSGAARPVQVSAKPSARFSTSSASRSDINSDVRITRTGKPILTVSGGRSSLGGYTTTVFGATGFLGRYVVNRLARSGCTVIVPFREEMAKRHLKVSGDLGRVIFMEMDLRNTASIEESVRHSDIVYNLIGRDYPTKNFDYEDVHVEGIERIAEAVAKYDIDRYVQVSSHSVDLQSPSEFYRSKAKGEQVARSIYPETTLVRPAPMFGAEDRFLHRLAYHSNLITSNWLQERSRPVHVIDVAMALEKMLHDDTTAAETYELYGPTEYSMAEVKELIEKETLKHRRQINIPKRLLKPIATYANKLLWWPIHSGDEVEREFIDQVIDPEAKTFADLGIEPAQLKSLVYEYVKGYRSSSYYDLPPMSEKEKREEKKYLHVIDDQ